MNVLILGLKANAEVQFVVDKISQSGGFAFVLEPTSTQHLSNIAYDVNQNELNIADNLTLSHFDSVYWQQVDALESNGTATTLEAIQYQQYLKLQYSCCMQMILNEYRLDWFNPWQAFQSHRAKPRQLRLAKELGATIPATLISNKYQDILTFMARQEQIIVKPIMGGHHTMHLTRKHTQNSNFKRWLDHPRTFQSYIPGIDVRSYVIGNEVFSFEIRHDHENHSVCDYKAANKVSVVPCSISKSLKQMSKKIMRALHMQWTAIDWRVTDNGQFVFLEANPSPMFVNAQQLSNLPIGDALVELILKTQ